jgi:hypothetical protein
VALNAIRRELPIWVKGVGERARKQFVAKAQAEHLKILADQVQRSGFMPKFVGFGDIPGRPVENAQRLIVYKYRYDLEVIRLVLKALQDASPAESGRYKQGHQLYLDGRPVPLNTPIRRGQEIMIANPVVYARRLEVGKTTSGRDFLISKPNKIYERISKQFGARYANAVKLTFGYVTMPEAYVIKGRLPTHYAIDSIGLKMRKRRQEVGKPVRAPAIFFDNL